MAKHFDRSSAGRSAAVPFQPGEPALSRHDRRRFEAAHHIAIVAAWCQENELALSVTNNLHHWQFTHNGIPLADWWPSSAKLVIEQQWTKGVHTHDYKQVCAILTKRFNLKPLEPERSNP